MFLSFWSDYYEFFIILIGIVIGMVIAYVIFFRPKSTRDTQDRLNKDKIEEENTDKVNLSFEASEDDLDDEYLSTFEQEKFVLGENSNILESMKHPEEEQQVGAPFSEEPIEEEEVIEISQEEEQEEFDDFSDIEAFSSERKDHEEQLNKIVREVIPLNDYADQNIGKYHVLFRKDDRRWYVKREGKEEIEKFLVTQQEAIAYATIQALIYATTIVVHDEDGKISKYEL